MFEFCSRTELHALFSLQGVSPLACTHNTNRTGNSIEVAKEFTLSQEMLHVSWYEIFLHKFSWCKVDNVKWANEYDIPPCNINNNVNHLHLFNWGAWYTDNLVRFIPPDCTDFHFKQEASHFMVIQRIFNIICKLQGFNRHT